MEVIDEEEFTVPTHGNMFEWEKYGFRLYISKTNLPPSMGECKINIRVSLSGQFQLPQDSDLFSPVFWINASSEFTKPVTLQIQHCALRDEATLSDLSFVSAKCSQKDLPYSFKQLDGGVFTRHSSYGSIQLKHFCGICVVGKKKTPRSYCAHLYQTMKQMYDWRFYFVITQDLNANNSVKFFRGQYLDIHCSKFKQCNVIVPNTADCLILVFIKPRLKCLVIHHLFSPSLIFALDL